MRKPSSFVCRSVLLLSFSLLLALCMAVPPSTSNAQTNPVPQITSLSPFDANVGGAPITLTVIGYNFVNGSVVRWNGINRVTTFISPTRIATDISTTDIATAATIGVDVVNPAPGGGQSNIRYFSIRNPVPSISSLFRSSWSPGGDYFTLFVNGSGFVPESVVDWNGRKPTITYLSPTRITSTILAADVPSAGMVSVDVMNSPPGGGMSRSSFAFDSLVVVLNPVPELISLSPSVDVATGVGSDFTLTVTGSNFVTGSGVRWNGRYLTTTYMSPTQLAARVPASYSAAVGTAAVTVVNNLPGGGTSTPLTFTINSPVPSISSLTPSSSSGGPAFMLTVFGSRFVLGAVVRWDGANRPTTYKSSMQLTAQILSSDIATGGTASVTVLNPQPGGGTSVGSTFTIAR